MKIAHFILSAICLITLLSTPTQCPAQSHPTSEKVESLIVARRTLMRKMEAKQVEELNNVSKKLLEQMQLQELEARQNELKIENNSLSLKKLKSEQQLLELKADSTHLSLINQEQELKHQQTKAAQQRELLLTHRQKLRRLELTASQERERMWILGILCGMILIAYLCYLVWNRRYIKAIKQKEARAAANRLKIEQTTRLKAFFLQNMSHDLRSPLNAIQGFSQLIYDDDCPISDDDRKLYLELIRTNTDLLVTLIDDIVDQSKLESGNYKAVLSDVEVNTLCQAVVSSNQRRLHYGVEMQVAEPQTEELRLLVMHTDKARVQQVLTNFITNACKYTEAGHIILSYELTNNHTAVRFSVTDTGRGIPADKAESVFDRFSMLKNSKSGTGLGLSICRIIADLLKGRCWVDTTYTDGARFCFEIPVASV